MKEKILNLFKEHKKIAIIILGIIILLAITLLICNSFTQKINNKEEEAICKEIHNLKENMKEPSEFKLINAVVYRIEKCEDEEDKGLFNLLVEYSGTNSYGARTTGYEVYYFKQKENKEIEKLSATYLEMIDTDDLSTSIKLAKCRSTCIIPVEEFNSVTELNIDKIMNKVNSINKYK